MGIATADNGRMQELQNIENVDEINDGDATFDFPSCHHPAQFSGGPEFEKNENFSSFC